MQDFLFTAGILGLFRDALLIGKGYFLQSGALGPALQARRF